ncbi:MAG: peptidylprolyl isomerase [Flavobacterium sp.]|nr:peptidylprolyl isomerase [Flavobacterium sp.]
MKTKLIVLLLLTFSIGFAQKTKKPVAKPVSKSTAKPVIKSQDGIFVEFETAKGKIVVQLEYQKTPITVANFVALVEGNHPNVSDEKLKGKPFYNGLKFHRVIKDFMIQGGDPAGNGSGGPGYNFKDEIVSDFKFDKAGILAMANSGPATNGSQFFITHKETPWLTGKHTIFGYVTTGQTVVDAIAQDDLMTKVTIVRKGAAAKAFNAVKVFSDYFANKAEDDKKMAEEQAAAKAKQAEEQATAKRLYDEKIAPVKAKKVAYLTEMRAAATASATGLAYKTLIPGTGVKPTDGTTVYIHYAGYLEDGSLFDSSITEVAREYERYDENRASQNGYQPFPFQYGKKDGLIPGFLEGIGNMTFNEKAIFFIPANLGYGERGAGGVIPPNANIIFEVQLFEVAPAGSGPANPDK